jgi:hypothetical protein
MRAVLTVSKWDPWPLEHLAFILQTLGVDSPTCKERNEVSSKLGAQVVLRGILGYSINLDAIPDMDPDSVPETVIEAESVRAVDGVEIEVYDSH